MEYRYGVIEVDPADDPVRRQGLPIAWVVAVCVAVVLFYAVAYAHRHLRMPAGDDALFYVVGLRSVARLGLQDPQLAVRPAFPLAGSVLATVTGSSAWTMAAAAPIAFAAGTGLAAAAIAARWRLRGAGLAAFAFLAAVSGVVARLVAGKVENGMALWLMAAVLAVTVWGGRPSGNVLPWTTGDRVRRSPAGSSIRRQWVLRGAPVTALVGAMTLVEWPLAVTFAAIVAAAWTWSWLVGRRRDAAGGGIESSELLLRLLVLASLAGVALGLLVAFVWNGAGPGAGIQNLPPGYRYGARLRDELSLARPFWTAPLLVVGLLVAWRRERHPPLLTVVLGAWLGGTIVVLIAGMMGVPGPTYRVLLVALPIALAVSAAWLLPLVGWAREPRGRLDRTPWHWIVAALIVAATLVPPVLFWWRASLGTPTTVEQLAEVAAAVRYARGLPGDDPAVLVVSRVQLPFAESLLYGRMVQSVSSLGTPPAVLIFVGRAKDALAGRPSTGIGPGEDAVLRDLFRRVGPALAAGSPVLSGRALDPTGFEAATRGGAATIGGDVVAIARGPAPTTAQAAAIRVEAVSAWPRLAGVALLCLAVLTLMGLGWSRLSLPSCSPGIRVLLAPAFGAAALSAVALVLVHVGVRPTAGGAWGEAAIAFGASAIAGWASRRAPAVPTPR